MTERKKRRSREGKKNKDESPGSEKLQRNLLPQRWSPTLGLRGPLVQRKEKRVRVPENYAEIERLTQSKKHARGACAEKGERAQGREKGGEGGAAASATLFISQGGGTHRMLPWPS